MKFGKIPSKVMCIMTEAEMFKSHWEDIDLCSLDEAVAVSPCFVADSESTKSIETGTRWARNKSVRAPGVEGTISQVLEENNPRTLTLCGLEKRMEGGRAFKVFDEQKRLYDLREEVLYETARTVGISPGGQLNGQFIWARIGSQMKLIRVGSAAHTDMMAAETRRTRANLSPADLEIGGIYTNRREMFIFVGCVDTIEDIEIGRSNGLTAAAAAAKKQAHAEGRTHGQVRVSASGEYLVIVISKHDQSDILRAFQHALINTASPSMWRFSKSITAVERTARLVVKEPLLDIVRNSALERIRRDFAAKPGRETDEATLKERNRTYAQWHSALANLRPAGAGSAPETAYEELRASCSAQS